MKTIAKKQLSPAQEARANHRQNLVETSKQARKDLRDWFRLDCPVGFVRRTLTLNQTIVSIYMEQTGAKEFKTIGEWNRQGRRIRKGEKAFPIWGAAEKATIQKRLLDRGEDAAHWYTLWPIAYLYHEGQTHTPEQANKMDMVALEPVEIYGKPERTNNPNVVAEVKLSYIPTLDNLVQIGSSKDAAAYIGASIFDPATIAHHETMYALMLNRANKCFAYYKASEGGVSATVLDVRMVFQAAILSNASAIILSHNHPSGNNTPSPSDTAITQKVKTIGEAMDIKLLDHIIMTPDKAFYSFADEGMI